MCIGLKLVMQLLVAAGAGVADGFGSRQGAVRALPDAAFPPSAPDFDCRSHDEGGTGHCQVRCRGTTCANANALCRSLWPRCRGVSLNREGTWGTLKSGPAPAETVRAQSCARACRWDDSAASSSTAVGGNLHFVCPSHLRDAAHYVLAWPFAHFGERAEVALLADAARCLPPVPVLYAQLGDGIVEAVAALGAALPHGYILVTGQTDFPPSRYARLLTDTKLLHWFAQNADVPAAHQRELGASGRLEPIPVGINCFEHGPELAKALRSLVAAPVPKSKLVMVNFGDTSPERRRIRAHFCGPRSHFRGGLIECVSQVTPNRVSNNPHLVPFYRRGAAFQYWVAPPGNGLDCHRTWEALYLGVVPIVLRTHLPLDALYESALPVLVVERYSDVTPELLVREYPRLAAANRNRAYIDMRVWRARLREVRAQKMAAVGLSAGGGVAERHCWGPAAD